MRVYPEQNWESPDGKLVQSSGYTSAPPPSGRQARAVHASASGTQPLHEVLQQRSPVRQARLPQTSALLPAVPVVPAYAPPAAPPRPPTPVVPPTPAAPVVP